MSDTKPSDGAVRAAEKIALDHPGATDANLGAMIHQFSRLIEDETHAGELAELAVKAKLQLEYLNEKFRETGTSNALLAQIDAVLDKVKGAAK